MFELCADKNKLSVRRGETVTSGSVNVYQVSFRFSPDWEGLEKTALFQAGEETAEAALSEDGVCVIPQEVLEKPRQRLRAGVRGTRGGAVVLPTVWADLGLILTGAGPGPGPTLAQRLERKGDRLDITAEGGLGLFAGDRLLSSVPLPSGSGGIPDHRYLSGRDAEDQHPIHAVTNLQQALAERPAKALSITEIIKIMEE